MATVVPAKYVYISPRNTWGGCLLKSNIPSDVARNGTIKIEYTCSLELDVIISMMLNIIASIAIFIDCPTSNALIPARMLIEYENNMVSGNIHTLNMKPRWRAAMPSINTESTNSHSKVE